MSFNKDFYFNYARKTLDALNELKLDYILSTPEFVQKIEQELTNNSDLLKEISKTLEASKEISDKYKNLSEMLPQLQKLIEVDNNNINALNKEFYDLLNTQNAISSESEENLEEIEEFQLDFVSNKQIKIPKSFLQKVSDASLFTIELLLAFMQIYYGNYLEGAITTTGAVLGYSDNKSFKSLGHMMCVVSLTSTTVETQIFDDINKYIGDSIGVIMETTNNIVKSSSDTAMITIRNMFEKFGLSKDSSLFEWLSPSQKTIAGLIESPSAINEAMQSNKFTISKQVEEIINKVYSSNSQEFKSIYFQTMVGKVGTITEPQYPIQEYQKNIFEYALNKINSGQQVGTAIKQAITHTDTDLSFKLMLLGCVTTIMTVVAPLAGSGVGAGVVAAANGIAFREGTPLFYQEAINYISRGDLQILNNIAPHLMRYVI